MKKITIKISEDISQADWLKLGITNQLNPNQVGSLFPNKFDRYFKLFLPLAIENENLKICQKITYKKLAELAGMKYDKRFSVCEFNNQNCEWPENVVVQAYDKEFIQELSAILDSKEEVIYYGSGDDLVPEKFQLPHTISGTIDDFLKIIRQLNENNDWTLFRFFPRSIFNTSKTWCLGWNVDIHEVGILILGCNNETAKRLDKCKELDFDELSYTDFYMNFKKLK